MTYSREELIAICERATVPEDRWRNRDSSDAQRQVGEAWALLKAGCDFEIRTDMGGDPDSTIWVRITFKGFDWFEGGDHLSDETFYLPTDARLNQRDGDWY